MNSLAEAFLSHEPLFQDVGTAEFAYRIFGEGEPLLLMHGWPLWGITFRQMLPRLAAHFKCYVVDTPGAGDTRWQQSNDFTFSGQARNFVRFVDSMGLKSFCLLAHNTGASIARQLALTTGDRVKKLVLIGTEIPGHRPPWIPIYQELAALPGAVQVFRLLLQSRIFLHSPLGFGNVFCNKELLNGDFEKYMLRPLIQSQTRMKGQMLYLRGIEWSLVDSFAQRHREILSPVLLIWGEQDPTFPRELAQAMVPQFANCVGLRTVPGGKLFVHEEKPHEVGDHALEFLLS